MSVFNVKSKVISNRDASPPVLTNPESGLGFLKGAIGVENTGNFGTDLGAAASNIRLLTLPSNCGLHSLEYATGDHGTSTLDIAAWYPTNIPQGGANAPASSLAGTLISSSAFASGIAGVDTSRAWTDAMGANATPTLTNRNLPLWQMLGLSSDPGVDIDLGFSIRVAVVQNGYVGLRAQYVD